MRTRSFILFKLLVTLAFLGSAWLIVQPGLAAAFTGQVVGVIDGDTIDVLHNGQAERIRLNGIDCPEKKQAYGKKAKQFTSPDELNAASHGYASKGGSPEPLGGCGHLALSVG